MISAKFFDDQYFNNAYYAKVGGVPCKEMNSLEVEFLFLTNFSLFVTYDTYKQYHTELRNHAMHSSCDCNPYRGKFFIFLRVLLQVNLLVVPPLVPELSIPRGGRPINDSKSQNGGTSSVSQSRDINNNKGSDRMMMDSPTAKSQSRDNDMMASTPF